MKKFIMTTMVCVLTALALVGCGGGGGGGGTVSKASTKVFLFGNITGAGKVVATVETTLNIPGGILVNYSSAPGLISGTFPIRKGSLVPSGPVITPESGISGTYTIASGTPGGTLHLLLLNYPGSSQVPLKSSTTSNSGNGVEIATINFTLATPGIFPTTSMPVKDSTAKVGQYIFSPPNVSYPEGSEINLVTTYQ